MNSLLRRLLVVLTALSVALFASKASAAPLCGPHGTSVDAEKPAIDGATATITNVESNECDQSEFGVGVEHSTPQAEIKTDASEQFILPTIAELLLPAREVPEFADGAESLGSDGTRFRLDRPPR